jgi:membrane protease YdiL (CAAX protease family)
MTRNESARIAALRQVALFWAGYIGILIAAAVGKSFVPPPWKDLVWGLLGSFALVALTRLFLRRTGRSWSDVGLLPARRSLWKALLGLMLGAGVYGTNLLLITNLVAPIGLGWNPNLEPLAAGAAVLSFLALSCMEELGFRGLPLRTLLPTLGAWKAQTMVAVAFGLCHLAFGWSWNSVLTGVIPSALLFGAAALASKGLAMPIALHAGLNIARWSFGESPSPGFWTMSAEESTQARIATVAPFIGVGVTLAFAVALWTWDGSSRRKDAKPGPTPAPLEPKDSTPKD